ncbi:MAG: DUF6311 domain-containing protein, partial [Halomonas sp.]|uniref:DUF6311 domain-containing protein n=1 Tax=Halomonas sp. TaxID=1486246 RepID=UPI003F905C7A
CQLSYIHYARKLSVRHLVNLSLNAALACRLLLHCGLPWLAALFGALLFAVLPAVTLRGLGAHGHEALTAHWLLLLAIDFLLFRSSVSLSNATRWLALLAAAVMVHFYLFFMVGVLWAGWWARAGWHAEQRGRWLVWLSIGTLTPLIIIALMWAIGYFQLGQQTHASGGYGYYSAELLTFFNPLNSWLVGAGLSSISTLWPGWTTPIETQNEGFSYAGFGIILLWLVVLYGLIKDGVITTFHALSEPAKCLLGLTTALYFLSMSDHIVIGSVTLDLHYEKLLGPLSDYLRASGRLAWPLLYTLVLGALVWISRRFSPLRLYLLLALAVSIQLIDLRTWHTYLHDSVAARVKKSQHEPRPYAVLNAPQLIPLWRSHRHLVALPAHDLDMLKPYLWLAAEHDLSINVAYLARVSKDVVNNATQPYRSALENNQLEENTIYLLTDSTWPQYVCPLSDVRCEHLDDGVTLAWRDISSSSNNSTSLQND